MLYANRARAPKTTALLLISLLTSCSAINSKSSAVDPDMQMAKALKDRGDLEGAAQLYSKLADSDKDSVDAELALGAIYRSLSRPDDAIVIMQDANKRQPENPAVLMQLGYSLIAGDRSEDAVAVFDHLIALQPDNALAYSGKGIAFDKAGNHLAAQELYARALKLSPDSMSIQNNLAMSLILNDQIDQAIELLNKLSAKAPDNKTVRQNLALAFGLKGNHKKALELNMQDVSPDQAKENLRFYDKYKNQKHSLKDGKSTKNKQVGFKETPEDDKEEQAPPAPVETQNAPAKPEAVKPVKTEPEPQLPPKAPEAKPESAAEKAPEKSTEKTTEIMVPVIEHTQLPTANDSTPPSQFPGQPRR